MNVWIFFRGILGICWATSWLWMTVADYPADCSIAELVSAKGAFYLWQTVILSAFFVGLINLTYYWEAKKNQKVWIVRPKDDQNRQA